MRIHVNILTSFDIYRALVDSRIAADVYPVVMEQHGSRTHTRAFEVQLGTEDKTSGPTRSRHYKNSGTHGAGNVYAATYDEWGYFLANLFDQDPTAKAGPYADRADFHAKTECKYVRLWVVLSGDGNAVSRPLPRITAEHMLGEINAACRKQHGRDSHCRLVAVEREEVATA